MASYRFNGITLDTGSRRIEGPDGFVHLPPKPFAILVELLRHPGRIVTREDLLDRVWPERPASDETLSRCVSDLRDCLGDDPKSPRHIETVPKVGYRFLGQPATGRGSRPIQKAIILVAVGALVAGLLLALLLDRGSRGSSRAAGAMLTAPIPVTTAVGDEDTPAFSPDGNLIVYAARDSGDENWDIRLQALDSGVIRELAMGPDREYAPVFSPDGTTVAFLRYRGEACTIVLKPLRENGPERELATCRTPLMAYLDWSPDGRRVAYSNAPEPGSEVVINTVEVETGIVNRLVRPGRNGAAGHQFAPRFSPDGERLAFIQGSLDRNELWLVDLATGHGRAITELGGRLTGLAWNRDGSALFFSSSLPKPGIWRIAPGAAPELVRTTGAYTPAFDPARGRLIYDQISLRTNLWSVTLTAGEPVGEPLQEIASTRVDNLPGVSPDGSRVAFVSDRSGNPELWLSDDDGNRVRRLTDWGATAIDRPSWSPDGSLLVYSVLQEGRWTGYLHPMNGLPPERLSLSNRNIRHPVWSLDDGSILYAGENGIRRVSPLNWRDEPALNIPGAVPLFEREGVLYYLQPEHRGIGLAARDGSRKRLLTDFDLAMPSSISFARDRLFFIATSPVDGVRRLFSHDLELDRTAPLFPLVAYGAQAHVSAAFDAGRLFFSQTTDVHSDLVLEGLP